MNIVQKYAPPLFILGLAIIFSFFVFLDRSSVPALGAEVDTMNGAMAISSTTVTTSSIQVIATSTGRQFASISNDGANDVYLAVGQSAVRGKGIYLKAGNTFTIDEKNLFTGAVNAIATTSTSNLSVITKDGI